MFVVIVDFQAKVEHVEAFRQAVLRQARNSLEREPECHQFDVCEKESEPGRFFLYELYSDEAAFAHHVETAHFKDFDATVADWVLSKDVRTLNRISAG